MQPDAPEGREDCLYLNIFRPIRRAESQPLLPVLFYIFGGALKSGDSVWGSPSLKSIISLYHGGRIAAEEDVIFVSANYRLGLLSFLATFDDGIIGNLGFLDQRLAMKWVQDNIQSFGGDPGRVLLYGESAGAFSVAFHVVSEASFGLFSSAAMLSGTAESTWFFQPREKAIGMYEAFSEYLGCGPEGNPGRLFQAAGLQEKLATNSTHHDVLECVQSLKLESLFSSFQEWRNRLVNYRGVARSLQPRWVPQWVPPLWLETPFGAIIDGHPDGLLASPLSLIKNGRHAKVPLILGVTSDEGIFFVNHLHRFLPGVSKWDAFRPNDELVNRAIKWVFGNQAEKVHAIYPGEKCEKGTSPAFACDNKLRLATLLGDALFKCSTLSVAAHWTSPVWLYLFDASLDLLHPFYGVSHATDIPFVTRSDETLLVASPGSFSAAKAASLAFSGVFARLGSCQNPNWMTMRGVREDEDAMIDAGTIPKGCVPSDRPNWAEYTEDHREFMRFRSNSDEPMQLLGFPYEGWPTADTCKRWDDMHPYPWTELAFAEPLF